MTKSILGVRLALGAALAIILFWVWYSLAADYDYAALAGTYFFHGNGETCTLYLRPDRSFVQEFSRSGEIQKAQGNWHRYGEAHVSFSNEFLKLSGEEMNADGQAHGQFNKTLGLFQTSFWPLFQTALNFTRSCFSKKPQLRGVRFRGLTTVRFRYDLLFCLPSCRS